MTAPTDRPSRIAGPARIWLAVVVLVVVVRMPSMFTAGGERIVDAAEPVGRVFTMTSWERVERASGISERLAKVIQRAVPEEGRLVLYSPYGGAEFELDASDHRGEWARLVRRLFEQVKNLLYPEPRDVHFARDADELFGKIEPNSTGKLFVLDGTQEPVRLTVGGSYELVHTEKIGGLYQVRLWELRGQ